MNTGVGLHTLHFMYVTGTEMVSKIVFYFGFFFEDSLWGDSEVLKSEQFVKHKGGVDKTVPVWGRNAYFHIWHLCSILDGDP